MTRDVGPTRQDKGAWVESQRGARSGHAAPRRAGRVGLIHREGSTAAPHCNNNNNDELGPAPAQATIIK